MGDRRLSGPLHIGFYTDAETWGGAESSLRTLIAALAPRFEATVIGRSATVVDELTRVRPGTGRIVVGDVGARSGIRARVRLRRLFVDLSLDVLHANLNRMTSCSEAITAALGMRGLAVVAVEHSPIGAQSRPGALYAVVMARAVGAHVAMGRRVARSLERRSHARSGSIRVIHNGVRDLGKRDTTHAAGSDGRPVVVGTLGRAHPLKGLDVLVEALVEAPEVHAHLIGAAAGPEDIATLAKDAGVSERVRLETWTPDPRRALEGFDILALPSREEGLPMCVLEAMMAAVPVVAADVGSVADAVVHGRTGLLVPPEDPTALAGALRRLADDERLRRAMGAASRRRALSHFTSGHMARKYEDLYEELAPARRPPARRS